ncbi:LuxR family transcriptional regulator [Pseudomonas chlororaphis]|uniref:LuxR family transcriptional regulator n=1 Tax=Pseudomonas chlororaphis TaxID=587753 RepID=A0A0D5XU77_9PSED|nr:LuxR family transcriptional regulator [Pseudomonas sp. MRSN 12121]AKA22618.1 LuxR family transcriptional regulator [Pseudomonas chlororaphis]MCB2253038.1 LuxR family transcriptional regulator [Pseudomonas chlororaphis]
MDSRLKYSDFIVADESQSNVCLQLELEKLLGDVQGLSYAYFAAPKNREVTPLIVSNYPSRWLKAYKNANYHLIDPIIHHGLKSCAPFAWSDALQACGNDKGLELFRRSSQYRICFGATFTLHDAGGMFSSLSLCDSGQQADFERRMADQQGQIQMALIRFHGRLLSLRTVDELFPESQNGPLSARELGVLKLVMMGKVYREIALMCAISERTVKFHMSNISEKLQVCNAKQAVYEAQRQGIL